MDGMEFPIAGSTTSEMNWVSWNGASEPEPSSTLHWTTHSLAWTTSELADDRVELPSVPPSFHAAEREDRFALLLI